MGWPPQRAASSSVPGDVDVTGLPGIHIECKRVERWNLQEPWNSLAGRQDREMPTVFHRRDRSEWLVTMRLEDSIQLYKEWEADSRYRKESGKCQDSRSSGLSYFPLDVDFSRIDQRFGSLMPGLAITDRVYIYFTLRDLQRLLHGMERVILSSSWQQTWISQMGS